MRKILVVVTLIGAVAVADPLPLRLKSVAEVSSNPRAATALELNLASIDIAASSVRLAASHGMRDQMRKALVHLRDTANLMLKDMDSQPPKLP